MQSVCQILCRCSQKAVYQIMLAPSRTLLQALLLHVSVTLLCRTCHRRRGRGRAGSLSLAARVNNHFLCSSDAIPVWRCTICSLRERGREGMVVAWVGIGNWGGDHWITSPVTVTTKKPREERRKRCVWKAVSLSLFLPNQIFSRSSHSSLDMSIIPTFSLSQYHKNFLACNCYFQPLF